MNLTPFRKGIIFAVSGYLVWGFLPIYWKLLGAINPFHILSFRILFSLMLISCILFIMKNFSWLKFFSDKRKGFHMTLAGILLCGNWGLFIWAVNNGYTIEAALGYYMNPLISIVMGLCFFRERLNLLQWIAFGIVTAGVLIVTAITGSPPWISLGLAFSFAFYGMIKKTVKFSALESLGVETLVVTPIALMLLFIPFGATHTDGFFNLQTMSYMADLPILTLILIPFIGLASSLPLFLFAKGVKMIPLSTLGFCQFLSPTITFLIGVFLFREPFPMHNFIVFGCIWAAAVLYIISFNIKPKPENP